MSSEDLLNDSEFFGGCGCVGGEPEPVQGGGIYRETKSAFVGVMRGNALAIFTSILIVTILIVLIMIFFFPVEADSSVFRWIMGITMAVSLVGTMYLDSKYGWMDESSQPTFSQLFDSDWRRQNAVDYGSYKTTPKLPPVSSL